MIRSILLQPSVAVVVTGALEYNFSIRSFVKIVCVSVLNYSSLTSLSYVLDQGLINTKVLSDSQVPKQAPGSFWDWKLLQKSIELVTLWLGLHTGGAGLAVVLNEGVEEQPSVVVTDELKGLVLAKVSGNQMLCLLRRMCSQRLLESGM